MIVEEVFKDGCELPVLCRGYYSGSRCDLEIHVSDKIYSNMNRFRESVESGEMERLLGERFPDAGRQ